jgi:geranylgeranyl pyrophosphate synthase
MINELADRSLEALDEAFLDTEAKEVLRSLALKVINRDS